MAKKITKKQLESRIACLERENNLLNDERNKMAQEIVAQTERHEDFKVEIYDMMLPRSNDDRVIMGYAGDLMPGSNKKRTVTKQQIARRIGRLVTIEDEYVELKDRTLPIPKMQVLADDRADRRNGGRGSGISMI